MSMDNKVVTLEDLKAAQMLSVKPDFEQDDSTAPDYIKNRPIEEVEIVVGQEEITTKIEDLTVTPNDGYIQIMINNSIESASAVVLNINGEEITYELIYFPAANAYIFGNTAHLIGGEPTDDLIYGYFMGVSGVIAPATDDSDFIQNVFPNITGYTIGVTQRDVVQNLPKINKDYLYKTDWLENNPEAPTYINNRPFYVDGKEYTSFLKLNNGEIINDDSGQYLSYILSYADYMEKALKVQNNNFLCKVIINENEYFTSIRSLGSYSYGIGDISAVHSNPVSFSDPNVPFAILSVLAESTKGIDILWDNNNFPDGISSMEELSNVEIEIMILEDKIVKVPSKYLTKPDWNEMDRDSDAFINNRIAYFIPGKTLDSRTFVSKHYSPGFIVSDRVYGNEIRIPYLYTYMDNDNEDNILKEPIDQYFTDLTVHFYNEEFTFKKEDGFFVKRYETINNGRDVSQLFYYFAAAVPPDDTTSVNNIYCFDYSKYNFGVVVSCHINDYAWKIEIYPNPDLDIDYDNIDFDNDIYIKMSFASIKDIPNELLFKPDFNETDKFSKNYIKNKPFGYQYEYVEIYKTASYSDIKKSLSRNGTTANGEPIYSLRLIFPFDLDIISEKLNMYRIEIDGVIDKTIEKDVQLSRKYINDWQSENYPLDDDTIEHYRLYVNNGERSSGFYQLELDLQQYEKDKYGYNTKVDMSDLINNDISITIKELRKTITTLPEKFLPHTDTSDLYIKRDDKKYKLFVNEAENIDVELQYECVGDLKIGDKLTFGEYNNNKLRWVVVDKKDMDNGYITIAFDSDDNENPLLRAAYDTTPFAEKYEESLCNQWLNNDDGEYGWYKVSGVNKSSWSNYPSSGFLSCFTNYELTQVVIEDQINNAVIHEVTDKQNEDNTHTYVYDYDIYTLTAKFFLPSFGSVKYIDYPDTTKRFTPLLNEDSYVYKYFKFDKNMINYIEHEPVSDFWTRSPSVNKSYLDRTYRLYKDSNREYVSYTEDVRSYLNQIKPFCHININCRVDIDNDGIYYFVDDTDRYTLPEPENDYLLPSVTSSDEGKFLRVNSDGEWAAETIPSAEGSGF